MGGLEYVDSLVLQEPPHWHNETMQVWRAMEAAADAGLTRQLGVSNVDTMNDLRRLHCDARIKPAVVQQKFGPFRQYEGEMVHWCAKTGVVFQSFSTLTANWDAINSENTKCTGLKYGVAPPVLFFRYVMGTGVVPLIGTSNEEHMMEDLSAIEVPLKAKDAANIMEDMSNAAVGKQFREESGDAWEPWRLFKLEEMIKNLRKQHEKKEKRKELWGRPGQKVRRALRKATPRQRKNILRRWNKTRARALLAGKAEAE